MSWWKRLFGGGSTDSASAPPTKDSTIAPPSTDSASAPPSDDSAPSDDLATIKAILRESLSASGFVDSARQNGFKVLRENAQGLVLEGPNSRISLMVLASKGPDTIFTLAIKIGDEPTFSLVDQCKLLFRD